MIVGVLALQGDVPEHRRALAQAAPDETVRLIRTPKDLDGVTVLLLPGGESTVIARLLNDSGLWRPLAARFAAGLPVLATCAGLILIARRLDPSPGGQDPPTFGLLDVTVRRNDYGAQVDSFEAPVELDGMGRPAFPGVFIRAPRVISVGREAKPFARLGGQVVGVRQGPVWGLTFHPELSPDGRILRSFLRAARAAQAKTRTARKSSKRAAPRATARR